MPSSSVGLLLRDWRRRRQLSQLELALRAEISTRHLSFVETGRARPTSAMIERLSEHLDVPLRERNSLLLAGGFAPVHPEHALTDVPMAAVSAAIDQVLAAHDPYPALVVDRHWEMVAANPAIDRFLIDVAPVLLEPPVNVLRLSLHPDGMAGRIVNYAEWRAHLRRQEEASADPVLAELRREVGGYRAPVGAGPGGPPVPGPAIVVPLRFRTDDGVLNLFSTTTVFGTPLDVTVSELAIESFFPADAETTAALRGR